MLLFFPILPRSIPKRRPTGKKRSDFSDIWREGKEVRDEKRQRSRGGGLAARGAA
jgi:hypothetical protein